VAWPFITRETVARETPAASATRLIVAVDRLLSGIFGLLRSPAAELHHRLPETIRETGLSGLFLRLAGQLTRFKFAC
jgi:hypothetical protein